MNMVRNDETLSSGIDRLFFNRDSYLQDNSAGF